MTLTAYLIAVACGRCVVMRLPELEWVLWIVAILGAIVIGAMHGRPALLEVP